MHSWKEYLPHIIIGALALILLGIAGYKLLNWNTRNSGELPGDESTIIGDVQSEDYLAAVNPIHLKDRIDDGVTTIVMIGDESLQPFKDNSGVASQVEELLDATVYNCYFPDSYVTTSSTELDTTNLYDAFSLTWIANGLSANNFGVLEESLASNPDAPPIYEDSLNTLASIDFDTVDIVVFLHGPRDYLEGRLVTDVTNPASFASYSGSYLCAVSAIKDAYPHIRIVIGSPMFCMLEDESGELLGSDLTNTGHGKLADYMVAAKNIAVQTSTTFLDNFYGLPANADNYEDYLEDYTSPNKKSRALLAERIAYVLRTGTSVIDEKN